MLIRKIETQEVNLKDVRKRLGLSQVQAAKMCGVHFKTWIAWETNRNNPDENNTKKLEDKILSQLDKEL